MIRLPPTLVLIALALGSAPAAASAQTTLADIRDLKPRETRYQGFELTAAQDVRVEAAGEEGERDGSFSVFGVRWGRNDGERREAWVGNAWILDLGSRRVVWELSRASTSRGRDGSRVFSGTVHLPAGSYAAYVSAYPLGYSTESDGLTTRVTRWFGADRIDEYRITVNGRGQKLAAEDVEALRRQAHRNSVVAFRGTAPERLQQTGFVLDRATEVEILAAGEAREDAEFDRGWIINADTREKVWAMTWHDSTHAGGAEKNRLVRATRRLPAGRYAAFYATDDSHDISAWNSPPPHDPEMWGLFVRINDAAARTAVKTFDYEHVPQRATIVALTGVGDGESVRRGFTLNRAMNVRIYAIGEGRDGRMFDYGWISQGSSRQRLWTMKHEATEHAGGDAKNRLVDTTLRLEKGSYTVHFVTDGSHSADDWNASAPSDGARWGITLLAADGTLGSGDVAAFDPKSDPSVVADLTGARDDVRLDRRFTLPAETSLRIVALGEGSGSRLVDYGWIEDARTGRTVWEMTYRMTEHAGGAAKNRRFDGTITLPAGEYVVRYRTDDSHAFGDWNAAPPDDPDSWGISIRRK